VHCAAGSEQEINLGPTSLAAPHAASSSVLRYSCTERRVAASAGQSTASEPGTERCLLASAAIRVASTAKPSPKADPSSCRMPRDAGADQKDQRTDRSCAACDRMARTRRGKIRKKDTPASRADRPSSPNLPATTDRENHSEALVASTFSTKSSR